MKITPAAVLLRFALPLSAAAQDTDLSIVADQVRSQGFACDNPTAAARIVDASLPDQQVYKLSCDGVSYRVHLIPDMAAEVTKLDD